MSGSGHTPSKRNEDAPRIDRKAGGRRAEAAHAVLAFAYAVGRMVARKQQPPDSGTSRRPGRDDAPQDDDDGLAGSRVPLHPYDRSGSGAVALSLDDDVGADP
jgi:hypothetical protein